MSFRLKLLLAMVLLVVGVTATTLLIMAHEVRGTYERHFQQSFKLQAQWFLQQREARLARTRERVAAAAASVRVLAAMENVSRPHPDQQDVDDLYQNGLDQLSAVLATKPGGDTNGPEMFFVFLTGAGQLLYPSHKVDLPFSLSGLRRIAAQLEAVGASVSRQQQPQAGYLALEDESGGGILEMVFSPVVGSAGQPRLGSLGVGFRLPSTNYGSDILGALWLDHQLYSSSIPASALPNVERALEAGMRSGGLAQGDFTVNIGEVPHEVYRQALSTGPAFPAAHQVWLYSLAEATAEQQSFRRKILLAGTVASLCALALSWLIARGLSVPLQQLVSGTMAIEHGDYSVSVPAQGRDELGRLARAFNAMAARVQASHERLAATVDSLRNLLYQMAHTFRAPLRAIAGYTELFQSEHGAQLGVEGQEYTRHISAAVGRMDQLVQDLLDYGRLGHAELALGAVGLEPLIGNVLGTLALELKESRAEVQVQGPWPTVWANADVLQEVLMNLVENAITFIAPGTPPRVVLWAEVRGAVARVWVQDNGVGIEPRYQERIFGLFETLPVGHGRVGTGIGLALVKQGLQRMSGRVGVESQPGQGSRFWFELPLAAGAAPV